MKRQHPLLSSIGIIFTAILLAGLAFLMWRRGGTAFSPGPLSSQGKFGRSLGGYPSHAEFETRCSLCHQPLKTTQDKLCLACHTDIVNQTENHQGAHGWIKDVDKCYVCHSEHQGKSFDVLNPGLERFDHSNTTFDLKWHQIDFDTLPIYCKDCHREDEKFTVEVDKCVECHGNYDNAFMVSHILDYGKDCLACHDGRDRMIDFNHANTNFPLLGKHANLGCISCHKPSASGVQLTFADFKATSTDCAACHTEPAMHHGLFDRDCAVCHDPTGWSPVTWQGKSFAHESDTGFSLALHQKDSKNQPIQCTSCHTGSIWQFERLVCLNCHTLNEQHQTQFGENCLECHDGVDRMHQFDHQRFFPLDGAHGTLACEQCHQNKVFKGTPNQCSECHAEPEIHVGFFGLVCQDCHTTQAWSPAQLRIHAFPLDHGNSGQVECKVCHVERYTDYTCYNCHDHSPDDIQKGHIEKGISVEELPDCARCHPTGRAKEN